MAAPRAARDDHARLLGSGPAASRRTVVLTGTLARRTPGTGTLTAKVTKDGRTALRRLRGPRALRVELSFGDEAGRPAVARARMIVRPLR